jgi:hypothetical protein
MLVRASFLEDDREEGGEIYDFVFAFFVRRGEERRIHVHVPSCFSRDTHKSHVIAKRRILEDAERKAKKKRYNH